MRNDAQTGGLVAGCGVIENKGRWWQTVINERDDFDEANGDCLADSQMIRINDSDDSGDDLTTD